MELAQFFECLERLSLEFAPQHTRQEMHRFMYRKFNAVVGTKHLLIFNLNESYTLVRNLAIIT